MISEEERTQWHKAAASVTEMLTQMLVDAFGGEVEPATRIALARIVRESGTDDIKLLAGEISKLRESQPAAS